MDALLLKISKNAENITVYEVYCLQITVKISSHSKNCEGVI